MNTYIWVHLSAYVSRLRRSLSLEKCAAWKWLKHARACGIFCDIVNLLCANPCICIILTFFLLLFIQLYFHHRQFALPLNFTWIEMYFEYFFGLLNGAQYENVHQYTLHTHSTHAPWCNGLWFTWIVRKTCLHTLQKIEIFRIQKEIRVWSGRKPTILDCVLT